MSHYRAIALDMDGTLLDERLRISPANQKALQQVRLAGMEVILTTGRHFSMALPYHYQLQLTTPILCSNGATIFDPITQKLQVLHAISDEVLRPLLLELVQTPFSLFFHLAEGIGYFRFPAQMNWLKEWSEQLPQELALNPIELRDPLEVLGRGCWKVELVYFGGQSELAAFGERVLAPLPLKGDWSGSNAIELVHEACSKGAALQTWAQSANVDLKQTAAFGDNHNDISMFNLVGLAIAMGNAPHQVQEYADQVTDCHNADGVAKGIHKWVLGT